MRPSAYYKQLYSRKKNKLGEGERVEGMKFLGIYLISGSEQPFALFNVIHSKWCKLDFDTNDAQQIGHFHCDSPTDMCRANIPHIIPL